MSTAVGQAIAAAHCSSSVAAIQVAVLEGDPLRFVGLCSLLEEESALSLHAATLAELTTASAATSRPYHLVLVGDTSKSRLHEHIVQLRLHCPAVPILASGAGLREDDVTGILARGAKGYVDHFCSAEEFGRAIRAVHGGGVWASRRVLSLLIDRVAASACGHFGGPPAISPADQRTLQSAVEAAEPGTRVALSSIVARLTAASCGGHGANLGGFTGRESEVLNMLVAGHSNREIGHALGIEERTVKAHVAKLMRKVGVENRVALSVHAIKHGLVPDPS